MMCTLLTSGAMLSGPACVGAATKVQSTSAASACADDVERDAIARAPAPTHTREHGHEWLSGS